MNNILAQGESQDAHNGAQPDNTPHKGHNNGAQNAATTLGAKAVRPPKPEALRVQAENIPDYLKVARRWVLWKWEYRSEQTKPWTKPPYQVNGRKADSTRPETWNDFESVLERYETGGFDGIGFALTPDYGLAGGDIDNALLDGGQWKPVVGESQHLLDTYFEQSPSGRGVRFFARGPLPDGRRKHGDFEIYNSGRYLTVTGHRLDGSPGTIEERPDEIAAWHQKHVDDEKKATTNEPRAVPIPDNLALDDNALLDKAMNAKNSNNFAALWEGQTIKGVSEDDAALCFLLAFWTRKDAARMEHLLGASGRVRDKWNERRGDSTWIRKEIENAIHHCRDIYDPTHPALRAPDPAKVAAQNDEREPDSDEWAQDEQPLITRGYPLTDTGNAERFIAQHGHRFLFSAALGWMVWDGTRWVTDERGVIGSWEKKTVRSIYREAQLEKDDQRPVVAKWAASSESASKRRAMMENVLKDGPRAVPSDFDCDKMVLNVRNGTLDLRTGELRPHLQRDRISKVSGVHFQPGATCPLWLDTLGAIFNNSAELIRFIQRAVGYSLTGLTREQCFFVLHGKGANGKSLILAILRELLGDYQKHAAASTLMQKRGDAIPNDVAMLRGARLVTSIETNEGRKVDEALVKALTGDDPFTARFFRQEFFTFTPEFKIFLATNHKPQVIGTDDGIWRRIRLVPFSVRFWDADKGETGPEHLRADKTLGERIRTTELPGILNWALDGCLSWQREGIPSPQAVRDATGEYRDECDPIAQFLEECAVVDERVSIAKGDLHKAFGRWAKDNELPAMSTKIFGIRLKEKGFTDKQRTGGARFWLGVALLASDAEAQSEAPKNSTQRRF